jgi:hypothetical protein
MFATSELGLNMTVAPRLFGIPRFMWGTALRDLIGWMGAAVRRNPVTLAEREMALFYFAGYVKGRHRFGPVAPPEAERTAKVAPTPTVGVGP